MANIREQLAKIDQLGKDDEQFRESFMAFLEAKDLDGLLELVNSRGCELTAEDFPFKQEDLAEEIDDAELEAVTGGAEYPNRSVELVDKCWYFGGVVCTLAIGVAWWS